MLIPPRRASSSRDLSFKVSFLPLSGILATLNLRANGFLAGDLTLCVDAALRRNFRRNQLLRCGRTEVFLSSVCSEPVACSSESAPFYLEANSSKTLPCTPEPGEPAIVGSPCFCASRLYSPTKSAASRSNDRPEESVNTLLLIVVHVALVNLDGVSPSSGPSKAWLLS